MNYKPYGKMETKFVKDFFPELYGDLTLLDRNNRRCAVKFNLSLEHPLITTG